MKKIIGGVIGLTGLVLMIGTAGASDMEIIKFSQIILQGALSAVLLLIGCKVGGFVNE